jgi:hypothetical protein
MVEWKRVEEVEYREREREREREVTEKLHMCRYVVQFLTCTIHWCTKYHGTNKPLEF